MKSLLPLCLLLLSAGGGVQLAAQERDETPDSIVPDEEGEYAEILLQEDGKPLLVVNFPWQRFTETSVEVRTLAADEVDSKVVFPLFFHARTMKGDVGIAIDRARIGAEKVATEATFTKDEVEYRVLGNRNVLGKPSIAVACRTTLVRPGGEKVISPRAIYPRLEPWSTDARTLFLSLPAESFRRPGKIRVWLLRGANIVWWENVDWPGYPGGQEQEPAGEEEAPADLQAAPVGN